MTSQELPPLFPVSHLTTVHQGALQSQFVPSLERDVADPLSAKSPSKGRVTGSRGENWTPENDPMATAASSVSTSRGLTGEQGGAGSDVTSIVPKLRVEGEAAREELSRQESVKEKSSSRVLDPSLPGSGREMNSACAPHTKLSDLDDVMTASPITRAILKGDHQLVLECLRQGENPQLRCPRSGMTFYHVICLACSGEQELKLLPVVYQMSNSGLDVNVTDRLGRSPLRLAIERRAAQVLAALLKCGAEVSEADLYLAMETRGVVKSEMMESIRRLSPSYWTAVHDMTSNKVNRLVKAWSRVNLSRNGQTLIEYAKQHAQNEAIVKLLLQNEASIELAHAVMAGDVRRAKVLMCDSAVDMRTCDTSVKNNFFEPFAPLTLAGAAIKLGHSDVLHLLKSTEVKDSERDDAGGVVDSDPLNGVVYFRKRNSSGSIHEDKRPVTSSLCVIF